MQIDDLLQLPEGQHPSPYNFPVPLQRDDTWGYGVLPEKLPILAVGWLGDFLPAEGDVEPRGIDQLWQAYKEKKVIVLGERDGVPGPAIAACMEAVGAEVIFTATECFV